MTRYRICRQISTRSTSVTPPWRSKKMIALRTKVDDDGGHAGRRGPPTHAAAMTAATIRM